MAANDAYREFIRKITACKTPPHSQTSTALTKVLASFLAFVGKTKLSHQEYQNLLQHAEDEFGGGPIVGVHLFFANGWQAAAVYRKNGTLLVVETKPASFSYESLVIGFLTFPLHSEKQPLPLLFRLTAWLARSVFKVHDAKPIPLLHKFAIDLLDLPETKACLDTIYGFHEFLHGLDMYITSIALASTQIDAEDMTAVDILHCFGLVYIGSVNEASSENEGVHLRATLYLAKVQEKVDHLWWIEDFTLYEPKQHNLVVRFNIGDKPMYMKRRLALVNGGSHVKDLDTDKLSPKLSWENEDVEAGILDFNKWVEELLPTGAKAMPYMRHEIIKRYHILLPRRFLFMVRPFLVNGIPGLLPEKYNSHLPPRLWYSPDLFVEPCRIPPGERPTTVHGEILIKPCSRATQKDLHVFLRIDGEENSVYRLVFHKNGDLLPEKDQLKIFVQSQNIDMLTRDTLQLVLLRRDVGAGGISVEFIFTSFCRPFTLCTSSMMCDYTIRLSTFAHDARMEPVVFPPVELALWSNRLDMTQKKYGLAPEKAIEKTLKEIKRDQERMIVPLIWGKQYTETSYYFSFCDGENIVKMRPLNKF